ncbi:hypothetical protein N7471_008994 [Penicillium samsonianum]|uniref:uncharacterized protein n=1 Tax=Penicillium samsonianum TaxID=1882272 RepID=UPI0025470283|nr:uncharacterized protein N7471_008994 [Penicillium samsonianum]KAJ6127777.1 hypothetical protein N7471_008994 [Penicillium samsonianum]
MDVLDRKELGRPLAAYIRELADPNTPRRYSGWKSSDQLPVILRNKRGKDGKLTEAELHTLMDFGPTVRKDYPRYFRGEGILKWKQHEHLDYIQDDKFTRPYYTHRNIRSFVRKV